MKKGVDDFFDGQSGTPDRGAVVFMQALQTSRGHRPRRGRPGR